MTAIINGDSPSVTFSDGTTQTTATPAPTTTGNIPFTTNGTSWSSVAKIVSGTAVASTSGTSIDFTSIPSWVKRITVMFSGVSTNGTSNYLVQIGAGSVTATGYLSTSSAMDTAVSTTAYTTGFGMRVGSAASVAQGMMTITNVTSNTWTSNHVLGNAAGTASYLGGGSLALGGTLDRVRITTVNGTDTFDAGSINILYE